QQAMEEQLARGEHEVAGLDGEGPRLVGGVLVQLRHELIQLPPDRCAIVEERRRGMAAEGRLRVERRAAQALEMPALHEKDVVDEGPDRRVAAAGLHLD